MLYSPTPATDFSFVEVAHECYLTLYYKYQQLVPALQTKLDYQIEEFAKLKKEW